MEKNTQKGKPVHQLPGSSLELPQYGWYADSERNKPQSNSLGAATFIFASGGMSLSCSAGFYLSFDDIISGSVETHMEVCWFVAVIIGAIIAAIYANQLTKRMFNLMASILVILNGIIFVAASTSIVAATIARYCDGLAFGLTIITAITAGSEQSVKRFRGLVLSTESVGITLGILFKIVCFNVWAGWSYNINEMHGSIAIVLGAIALFFTFFITIESPTFYLRRNEERAALECLRRLQKPHKMTMETYSLLDENKKLLSDDVARGTEENIRIGLIPMGKLCIFRVLISMSFSLPLTYGLLEASNITESAWSVYLYGVMRLLGTCFAIFSLDTLGRRLPTIISMFLGGCLLLAVGIIFSTFNYASNASNGRMQAVIGLVMVYQLCAGIVAPTGTTYLGEAFSISVKPYFILAAVICENFVQIIICCTAYSSTDSIMGYFIALGAMQLAFALVMLIALPETKKTTLRESLKKFRRLFNNP